MSAFGRTINSISYRIVIMCIHNVIHKTGSTQNTAARGRTSHHNTPFPFRWPVDSEKSKATVWCLYICLSVCSAFFLTVMQLISSAPTRPAYVSILQSEVRYTCSDCKPMKHLFLVKYCQYCRYSLKCGKHEDH